LVHSGFLFGQNLGLKLLVNAVGGIKFAGRSCSTKCRAGRRQGRYSGFYITLITNVSQPSKTGATQKPRKIIEKQKKRMLKIYRK